MLESEITQKMTLHAKKSLRISRELASSYGSNEVSPSHLLFAIYLEEGSLGNNMLENMGIKRKTFKELFEGENTKIAAKSSPKISQGVKSIITRAFSLASDSNYPYVGTEHLIYALLESENEEVQNILLKSEARDSKSIGSGGANDPFSHLSKIFDIPEISLSKNKQSESQSTPNIEQFCLNLNEDAKKRDEVIIGRRDEIERMINILGRKDKNNPVLLGDPGVGKTALVLGLAQKINSGEVPQSLINKRIMSLDMALVVAGTSFRGEFESRIKDILREATANQDVILFIDEIHNIVGAGNANSGLDAANILKPALSRGDIQCIGATTFGEYKKYIEKDPALERRFQPVKISEPSISEAEDILRGIKKKYESFHRVDITPAALSQAVKLSVRYTPDRFLPDKAIDLIDETASALRNKDNDPRIVKKIRSLENQRKKVIDEKNKLIGKERYDEAIAFRQKEKELTNKISLLKEEQEKREHLDSITINEEDIAKTVSGITGIPLEKLATRKSGVKIKGLESRLNSKVIGQKEAMEKISGALTRSHSGIGNPDRPLGSFLFLGPTGVGKTLSAKVLAEEIFGKSQSMIRIDMSEFMERHNVSRLTGAPAGYVGYEEGGKLTEKIRHQPYSLVLFDEIEKAHPDVFNILLQVLEDGILTDAEGREINFKSTVIILTSNIGTAEFTNSVKVGFESKKQKTTSFEELKDKITNQLKKEVKPEILNRLDNIIVFDSLDEKKIKRIVRLELNNLKKRLKKQKIDLSFSPEVLDVLAKEGLTFDQGARLVRKNVQEMIENEIAKKIVEEQSSPDKLKFDVKKGKIVLT